MTSEPSSYKWPSFLLKKEWLALLLLFVSMFAFTRVDSATPPPIISYQGKLLVNSASATTTRAMGFLLYDASTGGNVVYTASGTLSSTNTINVTPTNGIFSVDLGGSGTNALTTSSFQNNHTLYLEVIVAGQVLTPRKRITSIPYAINSEYLMGIAATSTSSSTYIPHADQFGNFTFTGNSRSTLASGGILYINPTSSINDGTLFGIAVNNAERFRIDEDGDVFVSGTMLVAGTSTFTNLINIEGRVTTPTHRGSITTSSLEGMRGFSIQGDYAYLVGAPANALEIINVADPEHPRHVGVLYDNENGALLTEPREIFISGNFAYVTAHSDNALQIIDISNAASPTPRGKIIHGQGGARLSGPRGVWVQGNYAYVSSDGSDAIEVVDVSDPGNPVHKGFLDGTNAGRAIGDINEIFVRGNYLYAADNIQDAFYIIDVSDVASPTLRGVLTDGQGGAALDGAFSPYVVGNIAYVTAAVDQALEIIDISNPAAPRHLSSFTNSVLAGSLFEVVVSGDFAYVASNIIDAVEIVDISSSTNPRHKASISNGVGGALLDGPHQLAVSGNYLYVGSNVSNALEIIDISGAKISNAEIGTAKVTNLHVISPSFFYDSVTIRGGLNVGGPGFLVQGDIGIVAASYTPYATNTLRFSHRAHFIASSSVGQNAYIFDTSSTMPTTTNMAFLSVRNNGTDLLTIHSNGGFISMGSSTVTGPFHVSGVLNASSTLIVSSSISVAQGPGFSRGRFFVSSTGDISTSGTLNVFGNIGINSSSPTFGLSVSGTAWITGTTTITDLLDVQGKNRRLFANPAITGLGFTDGQDMTIQGDYAYLIAATSTNGRLAVVDISFPELPRIVSNVATTSLGNTMAAPVALAVHGNYAYVLALVSDALNVIDISNPASPVFMGSLVHSTTGAQLDVTQDIVIQGNYAYVTSRNGTLEVADISNPTNPRHAGSLTVSGATFYEIAVSGKHAFIADDAGDRLLVVDISDPRTPRVVGSLAHSSGGAQLNGAFGVTVQGNFAYVANGSDTAGGAGVDAWNIIDISNPTSPRFVTSTYSNSGGNGITFASLRRTLISGKYLYVLNVPGGAQAFIHVYDVSSSSLPVRIGGSTSGFASNYGAAIYGNTLLVAANDALYPFYLGGAIISTADIGSLKVGNLDVFTSARFDQGVYIRGGLNVGNLGLLLGGDFGMYNSTSSIFASNTLRFSHPAVFTASATTGTAFLFNTTNIIPSSTFNYFFSLRNGSIGGNSTSSFLFSVSTNGDVRVQGTLFASTTIIGTPGLPGDLAENVDIAPDDTVEPGDVVVVDPDHADVYRRSTTPHAVAVAGVISGNPTIIVGSGKTEHRAHLAMVGRVPVKVEGTVNRGDLLVSGNRPGYAMRYEPIASSSELIGILGIALDTFDPASSASASGMILALIKTGFISGSAFATVLTVEETPEDTIAYSGQTNFNNTALINVTSIMGTGNRWEIDPHGSFISRLQTEEGTVELHSVGAPYAEYVLSGSTQLESGERRVSFDATAKYIFDIFYPVTVIVTLTGEEDANSLRISEKSIAGFTVKEMRGGTSNATFDWVARGRRRGDDDEEVSPSPPVVSDPASEADPALSSDEPEISQEEPRNVPLEETARDEETDDVAIAD